MAVSEALSLFSFSRLSEDIGNLPVGKALDLTDNQERYIFSFFQKISKKFELNTHTPGILYRGVIARTYNREPSPPKGPRPFMARSTCFIFIWIFWNWTKNRRWRRRSKNLVFHFSSSSGMDRIEKKQTQPIQIVDWPHCSWRALNVDLIAGDGEPDR